MKIAAEIRGCTVEPYVVGPTGVGVFKFEISQELSAFASFAYFAKYQTIGAYLGFASPGLKAVTDNCLVFAGRRLSVAPEFSLANPCPAVLFPLEFFAQLPEAQPRKLTGCTSDWVEQTIVAKVLHGTHTWLRYRRSLLDFLAADSAPFSWATSDVPRRLVHVAYLAQTLGEPSAMAKELIQPAISALSGAADFDGCDSSQLAAIVLEYFFGKMGASH
ncbi:MAG TPA: hypothetical protein VD932_06290 [Aquabacterium sp.]|nr:hypothetical protein [Aquabacterium sp.]